LLSIVPEQDALYSWFYREDELSVFISLPDKENTLIVTNENPGLYRLEVDNLNCKASIDFVVEVEDFELEVLQPDEICDSNIQQVTLVANVNEGIWQLNDEYSPLINQTTKSLSIATLENGNYPMQYMYTSEPGCIYKEEIALSIQRIIEPDLTLTGEVCSTEKQTIQANFSQTGTDYQWYYIPDQQADSIFFSTSDNILIIENEGYYGIVASRNSCRDVFSPQFIEVKEADTIFIPNVFTPNNDSLNDEFKIISNYDYVRLSIYNRWGKLIYSGDGKSGWDGDEAISGVYYWVVNTENCLGEAADFKGWVHLQR
jgi:gliding motility-associated-like protein